MILVTEVEQWLFMDQLTADQAAVPTILVEKDQSGARSFTPMRTLFQLKKWTAAKAFIPLLSCDEAAYKAYEVFHVDALPPYALLQGGRVVLKANQKDTVYEEALAMSGKTTDEDVLSFALQYIEEMLDEDIVLASGFDLADVSRVPDDVYVPGDAVMTGQRLFTWANKQMERGG
ncbi:MULTISPECIES: hypothetical protein [Exiguobacterium]|uniref:hypothetical protein n=1 Tax=Exiguobacterium TaxID=33986 RepID=UPI001BEA6141|nr:MULTISPECIES: hypothetical protein [Exiguobacterium]MCT4781888.1 hypothetical protein [Exiguobacterium himgiriensis]